MAHPGCALFRRKEQLMDIRSTSGQGMLDGACRSHLLSLLDPLMTDRWYYSEEYPVPYKDEESSEAAGYASIPECINFIIRVAGIWAKEKGKK